MLTEHKRLTAGFFRSVNSPKLFKEFFSHFKVSDKMNIKENSKNDDIYTEWQNLPTNKELNEALYCMNDIACEDGRPYLLSIAETLKIPNYLDCTLHQLTMILWLKHRKDFYKTYDVFTVEKADNLKILIGKTPLECNPTNENLSNFKQELQKIFQKSNGGKKLKLELGPLVDDKYLLIVSHENFLKPDRIFNDKEEIITQERRPIYDLILIYYPKTGILKLKVGRGGIKKAKEIAYVFATTILKKDNDHFQSTEIIDFSPLLKPDFNFPKRPTDEFKWVKIVEINFLPKSNETFNCNIRCTDTLNGTQDVMEQLKKYGYKDFSDVEIKSITLEFYFENGGRKKHKKVILRKPYYTNLDETPRDRHVEEALIRWGIINVNAKTTASA